MDVTQVRIKDLHAASLQANKEAEVRAYEANKKTQVRACEANNEAARQAFETNKQVARQSAQANNEATRQAVADTKDARQPVEKAIYKVLEGYSSGEKRARSIQKTSSMKKMASTDATVVP